MASRGIELREYLMNNCPISQDCDNPKIYAHLRGIDGYDYLICDFKDNVGYALILFNQNYNEFNTDYDCGYVGIDDLLEDKTIILYKSKYLKKKMNNLIKNLKRS